MTTVDQLSRLADNLVLAAMALLAVSLVAHGAELVARRHPRRAEAPAAAVALAAAPRSLGVDDAAPRPDTDRTPGPGTAATTAAPSGSASRVAEVAGRTATTLTASAVVLTCAAIAVRGVAAGRAPWGNMYEFGLANAAAMGLTYLLVLRRRSVRVMGLWIVALVLTLLGVSYTLLHTPVDDLVPVLRSTWLIVHVASAIAAGGLFAVGAVATTVAAVLARRPEGERRAMPYQQVAHTVHLVAFPIWTFAVIAGAIWAENAWGRYWGWDPKETWAFITWVFYAAHLHALSAAGWRRRAGVLALLGFAAYVFNFFGVNIWIPGLHSYAGV